MLTLSTKVRYATRILAFIADHPSGNTVSAKKISEAEEISFDYTEQILIRFKAAKLVKSIRGPQGGFVLTEPPEKITVANIISVIEGDVSIIPCLTEHCSRAGYCQTKSLWKKANEALMEVFSGTTVADLVNQKENLKSNKVINYEI